MPQSQWMFTTTEIHIARVQFADLFPQLCFAPELRLSPAQSILLLSPCGERERKREREVIRNPMAMLSVERISGYGALAMPRAAHVSPHSAAALVTMAGCRRSARISAGMETTGRRGAAARESSFPVCRSSIRPLSDSNGNVVEFQTEEEFNTIIKEAGEKLVVVDISTTTCGPCKMIFPKLVEMSLQYPDAVFLKINGDINNDTRTLMRKWGVRAVPSFRFYKKGEKVHSHTGAKLDELKTRFAEHYGQPIKVV